MDEGAGRAPPVTGGKGFIAGMGEAWARSRGWRERYHLKPLIAVLMYIVIPLIAIQLIMLQYPLLAKERFHRMMSWIVPCGMGLFAITLVQERFRKGTKARLALDNVYVFTAMAWLFGFLGGSTVIHSSYAGWGFSVDVTPMVVLIIVGTGLNLVRDVLEYVAHTQGVDLGPALSGTKGALVDEAVTDGVGPQADGAPPDAPGVAGRPEG